MADTVKSEERIIRKMSLSEWYGYSSPSDGVIVIIANDYTANPTMSAASSGRGIEVNWHLNKKYFDGQHIMINGRPVEPRPKIPEFLDLLKIHYPDDFEWLLWHPELLEGKYNG